MVSFARLAFLSFCRPPASASFCASHHRIVPGSAVAALPLLLSHPTNASRRSVVAAIASFTVAAWGGEVRGLPPTTSSCLSQSQSQHSSHRSLSVSASSSSEEVGLEPDMSSDDIFTGFLNAEDAAALDGELMSTPGFSLEQLMELAGLSVAEAVYAVVPPKGERKRRILLVCGPGNNGGDGLVAARHLVMFGYECAVVYPKQSKKEHFINLVQQCEDVGVSILDTMPSGLDDQSEGKGKFDAVVDAIFGFSFRGEPREPFASALRQMVDAQQKGGSVMISVDVPSGWNVDGGDVSGTGFMPDVLVSLTTPKLSAQKFTGRHFCGGRFLPPKLAEKYGVQMPPYPGVSQVMEISKGAGNTAQADSGDLWAEQYAQYMAQKEEEEEKDLGKAEGAKRDPTYKPATGDEEWAVEYAKYVAEKERALNEKDA